jgi:hypothetical protein
VPKLTPEEQGQLLLDLAEDAEVERVRDMTTEEIRELATKRGVDLEAADKDFDRILAESRAGGGGADGGEPGPAPRPVDPKVVRLEDRKARSRLARWVAPLAIAAGVVLMLGIADRMGLFVPTDPTTNTGVDYEKLKRAKAIREEAWRYAEGHRWSECLEKLDEAKALDPDYDKTERVQKLRSLAASELADGTSGGSVPGVVKLDAGRGASPSDP